MTASTHNRRNNFNLLRLVFAILVILSHSPELVDGNRSREVLTRIFHTISFGEFAVDGFFLLSGYLILQSWTNTPRLLDFIRSRVLRIFPAFIVATLVCVLVVGPLAATSPTYFVDLAKGVLLLKSPVLPAVFKGTHYPGLNGAMWTIPFEFICYLCVLFAGVIGITKKREVCLVFIAGVLIIFGLQRFGYLENVAGHHLWKHPLVRLGSFFLMGSFFYLYRDKLVFSRRFALLAAVVLIWGLFSWRLSELILATAGGYLLFFVAFRPISSISDFNKLPDVSYGVYLYGWPVQKLLLWYFPMMSPWTLFVLACVGALICGVVSWYAVEKPFLRLKSGNYIASPPAQLIGEQGGEYESMVRVCNDLRVKEL